MKTLKSLSIAFVIIGSTISVGCGQPSLEGMSIDDTGATDSTTDVPLCGAMNPCDPSLAGKKCPSTNLICHPECLVWVAENLAIGFVCSDAGGDSSTDSSGDSMSDSGSGDTSSDADASDPTCAELGKACTDEGKTSCHDMNVCKCGLTVTVEAAKSFNCATDSGVDTGSGDTSTDTGDPTCAELGKSCTVEKELSCYGMNICKCGVVFTVDYAAGITCADSGTGDAATDSGSGDTSTDTGDPTCIDLGSVCADEGKILCSGANVCKCGIVMPVDFAKKVTCTTDSGVDATPVDSTPADTGTADTGSMTDTGSSDASGGPGHVVELSFVTMNTAIQAGCMGGRMLDEAETIPETDPAVKSEWIDTWQSVCGGAPTKDRCDIFSDTTYNRYYQYRLSDVESFRFNCYAQFEGDESWFKHDVCRSTGLDATAWKSFVIKIDGKVVDPAKIIRTESATCPHDASGKPKPGCVQTHCNVDPNMVK